MAEPLSLRAHRNVARARDPLLATKLAVPPPRAGLVRRPRLIGRLDEAARYALTLISAPAGYGKTTLLAEWRAPASGGRLATAWLSLDERDDDPVRFWTYVVAALEGVHAALGRVAPALAQVPPPPMAAMLTPLLNALAAVPFDFALVLDDYHAIADPAIHQGLAFLLDHLPPRLHLILATRADPPLPLARLRARGQLVELRTADLRFTEDEASAFLGHAMGLRVSPTDVAALEARTEGWIAGLQLAALSLRGRDDVAGFIAAFTGSHRHILDYLADEVLARQPEDVKRFLLQTAILDRLTAPLCDAVTGRSDGQALLERLEGDNLFLLALDDARGWYRYHHLFAEMLRQRLERTRAGEAPALHARAAAWHERAGFPEEAVRHTLAAGEFEWAARLLEREAGEMLLRGRVARLRTWIAALPDGAIRSRPWLALAEAWALLLAGQFGAVEPRLLAVERMAGALEGGNGDTNEGANGPGEPRAGGGREVLGWLALARAALAATRADAARTIAQCRQALEYLPDESLVLRGLAAGYLGSAYWLAGDMAASGAAVGEAISLGERAGNVHAVITATCMLGQLRAAQGRLRQAADAYERALQLAAREYGAIPSVAPAHVGLSEVLLEWDDREGALRHAEQAVELGRQGGEPGALIWGCVALARARAARGDRDGATAALDEAERAARQGELPPFAADGVAARRAMLDLSWGDVAAAAEWARRREGRAEERSVWQRDVEPITRARLLLAVGRPDEAIEALERTRHTAVAGERMASVIACLALRAMALQAQGDGAAALDALGRALALAESDGYVRVFVDEGAPMAAMLARLLATEQRKGRSSGRAIPLDYVRRLLAALGPRVDAASSGPARPGAPAAAHGAVEILSGRELEVLRMIAGGASNREIASALVVSLGTVKKHLNNIFGKLGAHSRTQAVARARESGLLSG